MSQIKKALVLGSGSLKIGEAGEFDYSGSQCLKALRKEGIETILINPNIATCQTGELADKIYFLPVNPHFVEKVIIKEKPDGILVSFGGQTALNCAIELYKNKIFEKNNVRILGTPIETIICTEDRNLFVNKIEELNLKVPKSFAVYTVEDALKSANEIKYPVMIRAGFALGGLGSGVCYNEDELRVLCEKALAVTNQILIEEYLEGWKEIEYEVVRDEFDNCIAVCNMENFDPLGIHTGESIVVAPSQTLTNREYHKLRTISIEVIQKLGIIGECNIQFALDPKSENYRIIEVNARLSRSSALASKATGYPLALIAAYLSLGYSLVDLENSITKKTKACFEPALDYVVVKIPRWDLKKFVNVSRKIGSSMKSVGEVMAIGRKFEEALQKALRMLNIGVNGLVENDFEFEDVERELKMPTDERVFAVVEALKKNYSIDKIHELSKIDKWFLYKIENILEVENKISDDLSEESLLLGKQFGFSDFQIAKIRGVRWEEVRELRNKFGIKPFVKQIDTLAGEYPTETNYLYLTYNGSEHDIEFNGENEVLVLGSGAYRIGSSVEFDWCCVSSIKTLRRLGYGTIMLNYNPETVSTDYDECDKLYFDEISLETVLDICDMEKPKGVILSMGGQIPNNLAIQLADKGVNILGTSASSIDNAENRYKFSKLLDELKIMQPEWMEFSDVDDAEKFCERVGYPVLVRPSYVLSGAAMSVIARKEDLKRYLELATKVSSEFPVVVSKFIEGAKEIEIDAVASKGELKVWAISEHVENAGVHSGDATLVLPPQRMYLETARKIKRITRNIAKVLEITGPFNIQYLAKDNDVQVIECNLRASRSFPFVSKILKVNFIDIATKVILNQEVEKIDKSAFELDYVGVKAPQFSFKRLEGADPSLSVEMCSTGEVGCIGSDFNEALLKSMLSVGFKFKGKNILLSTGPLKNKVQFLNIARSLEKRGFNLFATKGTGEFLIGNEIMCEILNWPLDENPNVIDHIKNRKIDFVLNIPKNFKEEEVTNDYLIRRGAIDYGVPLITNMELARAYFEAILRLNLDDLEIKSWDEY